MDLPTTLPHDPDDPEADKLHEECGVFGVWNVPDAAAVTALGLHALQHRGQEATGIVTYDGKHFHSHKGTGLVGDNFGDARVIARLPGHIAIGHNRYATTGDTILRNVQPLYADFEFGGFAVAHNGNLTNAHVLRRNLVRRGCLFQSTTDSEVFIHLIAISLYSTVVDRLIDALKQVVGAYSLVALSNEALIGVRDPLGVRPLILGRIGNEGTGGWVLASETCALDIVNADFVRDVEPGEIVVINDQGVHSIKPFGRRAPRFCVFEYIYFARPDSVVEGASGLRRAQADRRRTGARSPGGRRRDRAGARFRRARRDGLRRGKPASRSSSASSATTMSAAPSSSRPTHIRHLGVKLKHSANRAVLAGKRVVLVDDSIVRGTTSRKIVEMVRAAGAREVHMRISSPPTTHSCFYGIDTPERSQLLASHHSIEEMGELIGADSLAFISIDGLYRALGQPDRDPARPHYCDACFTGEYPIPLPDQADNSERQLSLLAESY